MLWVKGSGTDLATITAAGFAGLRLDELLPLRGARRWTTRRWSSYLLRSRGATRPATAVDRDAAACIRPGRARRPHAPGRRHRADLDAGRRRLADETFGDEAVWLDYQRPGFDMSRGLRSCSRRTPAPAPCCSSKHGLVTWGDTGEESYRRRSSSSPEPPRRSTEHGRRPIRSGRPQGRGAHGRRKLSALLRESLPALRGALLADTDGVVLEVDRSPEAVAFASSARAPGGQPDRRAVPRPPDQHEAQAARRRVRSRDR